MLVVQNVADELIGAPPIDKAKLTGTPLGVQALRDRLHDTVEAR